MLADGDMKQKIMLPLDERATYISQPAALNVINDSANSDIWNSSPVVCAVETSSDLGPEDGYAVEINIDNLSPPVPPDGGWGWMITIGSFICMILVDGMCFSYGIFLSELEEAFGATKMQMTLAGSLLTGCYFMVGPLVSGLLNRFGGREIVMVGTIVSTSAILGSTFIYNVNAFILVFGVLGGIGYGLIYLPAATIVTSWFVKKRATVTGIVMAGSGIGGILYSLFLPPLIRMYTWRGCIVVLAALNLNCMVAGALFRPLVLGNQSDTKPQQLDDKLESPTHPGSDLVKKKESNSTIGSLRKDGRNSKQNIQQLVRQYAESVVAAESEELNTPGSSRIASSVRVSGHLEPRSTPSYDDVIITHTNQLVPLPEARQLIGSTSDRLPMLSMEVVNRVVEDVLNRQVIASTTSLMNPDSNAPKLKNSTLNLSRNQLNLPPVLLNPASSATVFQKPNNYGSATYFASAISLKAPNDQSLLTDTTIRDAIVKELRKEIARPMHKKDLFLSGSVLHMNEYMSTTDVASYIRTITAPAEETHIQHPIRSMIKSMLGLELLKSPTFLLLAVSSVLSMVGYCVPYQFLKDNAQFMGAPESQASHLLAYIGAMNTFGRILIGWFSDFPWANVIQINNAALCMAGIATALVPLLTNYGALIGYACAFGFSIAAFISVRTILIVEVLGLDRLTNAFGFLLLFQAFALIASPPGLGYLYDYYQIFDYTFVVGGLALFLSGVLCFPLAQLAKWENRSKDERDWTDGSDKSSNPSVEPIRERISRWFSTRFDRLVRAKSTSARVKINHNVGCREV